MGKDHRAPSLLSLAVVASTFIASVALGGVRHDLCCPGCWVSLSPYVGDVVLHQLRVTVQVVADKRKEVARAPECHRKRHDSIFYRTDFMVDVWCANMSP